MSEITTRTRKLRKNLTAAEQKLWDAIRNRKLGIKFRRQYPIIYFDKDVRHCFIADFASLEQKIVIELDGKIHDLQKEYDVARSHIINKLGFKVIRFTNENIFSNIETVISELKVVFCSLPHADGEGLGMGAKHGQ